MGKSAQTMVSVRMEESDLRKLQLIAQICDSSVGALIRTAVEKHIKHVSRSSDFKAKAPKILERNKRMMEELFEVAGVKKK